MHLIFFNTARVLKNQIKKAVETFDTMKELEEEFEDGTCKPTANEFRSMLHILSQSKDVERGANWERSVEILREAQALDLRLTEVSFNTGAPAVFAAASRGHA